MSFTRPVTDNACKTVAYAVKRTEARKHSRHHGRFAEQNYRPFAAVQECYDRIGSNLSGFLQHLATHASQSKGGSTDQIKSSRGKIGSELTVSLARVNAEKVFEYIRGALLQRRKVHPISAMLDLSK